MAHPITADRTRASNRRNELDHRNRIRERAELRIELAIELGDALRIELGTTDAGNAMGAEHLRGES
jgi:hypothetical protein